MRVLLHSCCGPCSTFPLGLLRSLGHQVDGVFVNPNIYPDSELEKRWETYRHFAEQQDLAVRRLDIPHRDWASFVARDPAKPGRCRLCYEFRLGTVAALAKSEGYDCFTTTLLVSVYQDHEGVGEAGLSAAKAHGVPFMYQDFRVGYRRSREMARGQHLYMQKYCGCEFSLSERSLA